MNDETKISEKGDAETIEAKAEELQGQPETAREEAVEEKVPKKSSTGKQMQKLEAALEAAEKERDDFKDKYMRTFSDFNNYKKRSLTNAALATRDGQSEVLRKVLPVLDSFERALEPMDEQQGDAFVKGMFMVYRQLSDAITAIGVKEIQAQDQPFDPNLHQAISIDEAAEGRKSGVVTGVLQKGYTLDDKVLRHSMVTVSK